MPRPVAQEVMMIRSFCASILSVSVLAPLAGADQLCVQASVPVATPQWSATVSLPKFDPALGTLLAVDVRLTVDLSGMVRYENLDSIPTDVTMTIAPTTQALRPDSSPILALTTSLSTSQPVGIFDGVIDFGGPSGFTHSFPSTLMQQSIHLVSAADLALFLAASPGQTIPLGLASQAFSIVDSGSGNAVASLLMQTGATLDVCYEYDPAVPFCFGDGSGAACPCGNFSAPGADQGCLNSLGLGGQLRGSGSASLAVDSLALTCSNLPATATVLLFQGTDEVASGAGVAFGDGLRCAGGTVTRLGTVTASGGAATFAPAGGLGAAGGATAGTTLRYQAWYRNVAPFCTPDGFNLSNGLRVRWTP